jgi:hypothetical protein
MLRGKKKDGNKDSHHKTSLDHHHLSIPRPNHTSKSHPRTHITDKKNVEKCLDKRRINEKA